jgi:MFS family permease
LVEEAAAKATGEVEATPRGGLSTFSSLRYRDFRFLWLGQVGHAGSLWMEQIARPVLILQLTDSALQVGLVVAVRMAPMLIFGLLAGVAADRFDRKRILLTTQAVTLSAHALIGALILAGLIAPWHVFATAFITGVSLSFNQPARQSLIPKVVPREAVLNAVSLNTTAINLMRVVGPGIAGVLLLWGIGPVYLLMAMTLGGVMLATSFMRIPHEPRGADDTASVLDDLKESFAFVARERSVLFILGPALIIFVFGFPYQGVFVPLFATRVLDLGDSGVGALIAVTGVGALVGSLVMASQTQVRRRGLMMITFLALFSVGLLVFSRSTSLPLSIIALMAAAAMSTSYMSLSNSLLLELSPPAMHGRVMSLMSLDRGLIPLGAVLAGVLASQLGAQDGLLVMGLVCLILTAGLALMAPTLRRLA